MTTLPRTSSSRTISACIAALFLTPSIAAAQFGGGGIFGRNGGVIEVEYIDLDGSGWQGGEPYYEPLTQAEVRRFQKEENDRERGRLFPDEGVELEVQAMRQLFQFRLGNGRRFQVARPNFNPAVNPFLQVENEAKPPPPNNPLGRAFRNLFGPKKEGERPKAEDMPTLPEKETVRSERHLDRIDERGPGVTKAGDRLLLVANMIKKGEHADALLQLENLLKAPVGTVVRANDGSLRLLHEEAHRLLGDLPAEFQTQYRDTHAQRATRDYQDAETTRSMALLTETAWKYLRTPSGRRAADALATLHIDRSEYGLARRWMELVAVSRPDDEGPDAIWSLKYAYVLARTGAEDRSRSELDALTNRLPGGTIQVAGQAIPPAEWVAQQMKRPASRTTSTPERLMIGGGPTRSGRSPDGTPLLLERWSKPSTGVRSVMKQVEQIYEDIEQMQSPLVPAWQPLAVDGKLIVRSFSAVHVLDAETGRELWSTREELSPERLLTGRTSAIADELGQQGRVQNNRIRTYVPENNDHQPIMNLLYREAGFGEVSTDGERLYVLEEFPVLATWNSSTNVNRDPYWRDWESNVLVAYGLDPLTGGQPNIRWRTGGEKVPGPFGHMTGVHFFGPPVRSGPDLFIVGETEQEIYLFSLEPDTGHERFRVLLGYPDASVAQDMIRRQWSAQVAVSEGIVVCQTTLGWVVGVDRHSRTILWAARHREPPENAEEIDHDDDENFEERKYLGARWFSAPPMIVGHRVVVASPEDPSLICLDLASGRELWRYTKNDNNNGVCVLAGVGGGRVLLHGSSELVAVSLETGELKWRQTISTDEVCTGRALITESAVHVPMNGDRLDTFDLKSGKKVGSYYLSSDQPTLGNLLVYADQVVSQSPFGVVGFELDTPLKARIAARRAAEPDSGWPDLQEASIAVVARDWTTALEHLQQIDPDTLDDRDRLRYRAALWDTSVALLDENLREAQSAPDTLAFDEQLSGLGRIAETDAERLVVDRLRIGRRLIAGKHAAAWEDLSRLMRESDLSQFIDGDAPGVRVRLRLWVRTRLQELIAAAPAELREEIKARMTADLAAANSETLPEVLELWGFHPEAEQLLWQMLAPGDSPGVSLRDDERRFRLLSLMHRASGEQRLTAGRWLAEHLASRGLVEDAAYYREMLAASTATTDEPEAPAILAAIDQAINEARALGAATEKPREFTGLTMERSRNGSYYYSDPRTSREWPIATHPLPFFLSRRVTIRNRMLTIERTSDFRAEWSLPLQSDVRAGNSSTFSGVTVGHRMYVLHRDLLHCLDPVSRRLLWTEPLGDRVPNHAYRDVSHRDPLAQLFSPTDLLERYSLAQRSWQTGMIAFANSTVIGLYGHRRVIVIDAVTGRRLWTAPYESDVESVFATSEYVCFVRNLYNDGGPQDRASRVLRAGDGSMVSLSEAQRKRFSDGSETILDRALHVDGTNLVVVSIRQRPSLLGLTRPKVRIVSEHPLTGRTRWSLEFPTGSTFAIPESGLLAALLPDGTVQSLDLAAGTLTTHGKLKNSDQLRLRPNSDDSANDAGASEAVPAQPLTEDETDFEQRGVVRVFTDRGHLYANLYGDRERDYEWDDQGFDSEYLVGTLVAFDRHPKNASGERLWSSELNNEWLVNERLRDLPFLLFMRRKHERVNPQIYYYRSHVTAIDKRTGELLVDEEFLSGSNSFRHLIWNYERDFVDLSSYRTRLRFRLQYAGTGEPPSGGPRMPLTAPRPAGVVSPVVAPRPL